MPIFKLSAPYTPTGDQPQAIEKLVSGIKNKAAFQTLLGVTGSGKTFTMANVITELNRPALVISHNKTLAAQLYQEFKEFFPENAAHYFVSYYDYYQPEAYMPVTDTYIEKDAKINDFIDQLRHAATASALTRRDFIVVASVSCIYGLGDPEEYEKQSFDIKTGQKIKRQELLKHLTLLQYARNDIQKTHGTFSVKGEVVEIVSPDGELITKIELFGDNIEALSDRKSGLLAARSQLLEIKRIFPAKHFVTPQEKLGLAIVNIERELAERLHWFKKHDKLLEAQRLEQRTSFDMEMLEKTGYVNGIENYSRQLSFRQPGEPPSTLLDYLPDDTLFFIDESHMSMPQIRGMYAGDQSRKQTLVDYGFRLPSAMDNRPLKFEEFEKRMGQTVFVSATPGPYEFEKSIGKKPDGQLIDDRQLIAHGDAGRGGVGVVEQLIRPTGLLDPKIEIRPATSQIKNAEEEILKSVKNRERILVLTLTKRLAEEITDYLLDRNIKAEYLHSEIKTIERSKILQKLREGDFDVLVGINLLREGLDLPEVGLILILDADKEGFLRNTVSLIQTVGRAARHPNGRAILYADIVTKSIQATIDETNRRRKIQEEYNKKHGVIPQAVVKEIRKPFWLEEKKSKTPQLLKELYEELRDPQKIKLELERQMLEAANELNFEKAAELRDIIKTL